MVSWITIVVLVLVDIVLALALIIKSWQSLLFFVLVQIAVIYALNAPGADGFMNPSMARVLFFHLPCAFIATWYIILSAWFGGRYLMTGEARYDGRVEASVVVSTWFAVLTMGSGIVFSKLQWNAWWHNDARQTSFLVVLLLCAAGLALRGGLSDDQKAAKACSAYSVATVLPMLFLIFVLPRVVDSIHPSDTIPDGKLDTTYRIGVLLGLIVLGWASRYFYMKILTKRTPSDESDFIKPIRPIAIPKED